MVSRLGLTALDAPGPELDKGLVAHVLFSEASFLCERVFVFATGAGKRLPCLVVVAEEWNGDPAAVTGLHTPVWSCRNSRVAGPGPGRPNKAT